MYIKFQNLKWKNVLSYGSKQEEFNFQKGLHLISGANGEGKSAILDVLSYCLYGIPYRKIKLKELINRRNRRNLYTEVSFKINSNEFRIVRCMIPNKLQVYKNDEPLELLSSKKLTQGEIDKILGVDYHLFKQIISLAINYNKPFLSLTTNEKRGIIESIFNIKVFGEMLKILKKKNTGFKMQASINRKTITLLENALRTERKQLKDMKHAIKDFDKNKFIDLKRISHKIDNQEKDLEKFKCSAERKKTMAKNIVVDLEPIHTKKNDITKQINITNYSIDKITKDISALEENDKCPLCNVELTAKHKTSELGRLNKETKKKKEELVNNKKRLVRINHKIGVAEQDTDKKNRLLNEATRIGDKIKYISTQMEELLSNKKGIEDRELNFNIEILEKIFEEKKEEYSTVYTENKLLLKEMRNSEIVENILSENGIKAYFFKKLIPLLNAKVNDYLSLFDMPIKFGFNEVMDEEITQIGTNYGKNVPYYGMSAGERKRIDMAILLSFIAITKIICNWNTNLLIFDELLDTATDSEGLEKMVQCLKDMIANSNVSTYIISHRMIEDNFVDDTYVVKKVSGFSKVSLLEK